MNDQRKTILHVDDEEHIREQLGRFLKKKYDVIKASTIEEARKVIATQDLDFIIVDLKLSGPKEFSGVELILYTIRLKPKTKTIILTGYLYDQAKGEIQKRLEKEGILKGGECEPFLDELKKNFISKGGPNYIEAVLKKLEELGGIQKKKCFVIMPMSDSKTCTAAEWGNIFNKIIKPAVEESGYNYECTNIIPICGSVTNQIIDFLNRSELVIADFTDRNANVTYELGVRFSLSLGDATILISQRIEDIPSDLRDMATILYKKNDENDNNFKQKIKEAIEKIERNAIEISPVRKYLNPLKLP
jgi:CheY-like chemotaxis protein